MADIKRLAKETAIYGVSSILGRFLNWCLVPLYTYVLADTAEFGIYTNIYAWTSFMLVVLVYGMETGLFRFINKEENDPLTVYGTALTSLFVTSSIFVAMMIPNAGTVAGWLGYREHPEYIAMMSIVLALDAFSCIPFCYLRQQKQSVRFALLKLFFIVINIVCNIFFLVICPRIAKTSPEIINWFYDPDYGVGYIFVSNLIATSLETLLLLPYVFVGRLRFSFDILKRMLKYSLPLLLLGVVGIMNQSLDKMIYPMLVEDRAQGEAELGIYGACFKIALIMMLFTQAFRYAYEPFVFSKNKDSDSRKVYADTMKYYIITALAICLGMIAYLDVLKYLIHSSYWDGLVVVPIILASYLFQGIYFNLSFWYKLTDRTMWGTYLSLIGCAINCALLFLLVPRIGYVGAAIASLAAYTAMMLASYFLGQKYMPIDYDLRAIFKYMGLAAILFVCMELFKTSILWINILINTCLFAVFVVYLVKTDLPLSAIPIINKLVKRGKKQAS